MSPLPPFGDCAAEEEDPPEAVFFESFAPDEEPGADDDLEEGDPDEFFAPDEDDGLDEDEDSGCDELPRRVEVSGSWLRRASNASVTCALVMLRLSASRT